MKIIKFDMGNPKKNYNAVIKLNSCRSMNFRNESLESARLISNRFLEKSLGSNYHLRLKVYPFHVLRENPLASGAGADRMSTGMQKSYGKSIGSAARIREGQTVFELRVDKEHIKIGREALDKSSKKLPCTCKIVVC